MLLVWLRLRSRRRRDHQDQIENAVLRVLVDAYPGGLPSLVLKQRTGCDPGSVTAVLDRFELAGQIESWWGSYVLVWPYAPMRRRHYRLTGPGFTEALARLQDRGTKR